VQDGQEHGDRAWDDVIHEFIRMSTNDSSAGMTVEQRIKQELQTIFDRGETVFRKLTKSDEPYRFTQWADDKHGQHCLYYQFASRHGKRPDNKKRVPLSELRRALYECLKSEVFRRDMFKRACPVAQSAGPCGFAVTGGCLEKLGVARYNDAEHEFTLIDRRRAQELLGQPE
jgi:hypothetical protein